jgi:hypothetical protein
VNFKVLAVTFITVLIFRKTSDDGDEEDDPLDDGGPIYIDEKIGDINDYLDKMEVNH